MDGILAHQAAPQGRFFHGKTTLSNKTVTAERVRELFNYCPETGILTNRVKRVRVQAGSPAGCPGSHGYLAVGFDGGPSRLVHRIIWLWMTGEWPQHQIDHVDGDRKNNRWANLREATRSQNIVNRGPNKNNRCGLKGVFFHSQAQKWRARLYHNKTMHELGLHSTPEAAHAAYARAARKIHGPFARTA